MTAENPFLAIFEKLTKLEKKIDDLKLIGKDDNRNIPDLGGIDLAQEVTGLKKATIYSLSCKNEIPYYKRGKRLYFKKEGLLTWITEGRKVSIPDQLDELLSKKKRRNS